MNFRNILVFLFLLSSSILSGQLCLTRQYNQPRVGDVLKWTRTTYQPADSTGKDCVWDFSKVKAGGPVESVSYGFDVRDGSIVKEAFSTRFYYHDEGDTVFLKGYENESSIVRHVFPRPLFCYPFAYGDSVSGYLYTRGKYCDRLSLEQLGTGHTVVDGEGILILPGKDTLRHVLQITTTERYVQDATPITASYYLPDSLRIPHVKDSIAYRLVNDSSVIELRVTSWYARGYRYPLFESYENLILTPDTSYVMNRFSLYCSLDSMESYVGYDPENEWLLAEGEDENPREETKPEISWKERLELKIYPNPVRDELRVEYILPEAVSVNLSVQDMTGRILYSGGTHREEGDYRKTIPVSGFPRGQLLLVMRIENEIVTRIIIKE
ncbi:T9SS type A sorting domain-containing protein [Coprobacter tertius]|uniref:T9SS type A sorting domain-containing protein n=1 Tax=Coprobacter tertius TaxID=2944915 RepID=A0ABT1MNP2_9BACT|nr:T9SS type A sorting domain-containing protein [Coprobacter tertius]MCP9612906.1 T9SS type A sorting domain-containing protein [Coprobacter tertius]